MAPTIRISDPEAIEDASENGIIILLLIIFWCSFCLAILKFLEHLYNQYEATFSEGYDVDRSGRWFDVYRLRNISNDSVDTLPLYREAEEGMAPPAYEEEGLELEKIECSDSDLPGYESVEVVGGARI